jgi:small subunit ribosomal protein S8
VIFGIERFSKPSRRVYVKGNDIKPVLNGMGISILSTSKGIMTDKQAIREKVGGEILCNIW